MKKLHYIEPGHERALMEALAKHGPLSIGIDAACTPFRFYTSGVLDTTECSMNPENIDHAVLLVGYGEEDGVCRACQITSKIWLLCALQRLAFLQLDIKLLQHGVWSVACHGTHALHCTKCSEQALQAPAPSQWHLWLCRHAVLAGKERVVRALGRRGLH